MKDIFFSIIIPVYNVEQYLDECLESVLAQTYKNYEVICVNDASTDNSYKILEKYAYENEHVQIINNTVNKGLSCARNSGMMAARGKYIVFVDSDDMLKLSALQILHSTLSFHEIDILYFNMEIRNEGKWAKERSVSDKIYHDYEGIYTGQELFVKLYKNNELKIEAWRQVFSKKFLCDNNLFFYEGIYHEDNLFSVMCAIRASKVMNINEKLYLYRRRDNSIMSSITIERTQSFFMVFIELWRYWRDNVCSAEMNEVLEDYLNKIFQRCMSMRCYFPDDTTLQYGGSADKFMYRFICKEQNEFLYVKFSAEQLQRIYSANQVMIYGAGKVGVEMTRFLQLKGIGIKKILVSEITTNPSQILGVEIVQADKANFDMDELVIIAIDPKNEKVIQEIKDKLKKLGMKNVMQLEG